MTTATKTAIAYKDTKDLPIVWEQCKEYFWLGELQIGDFLLVITAGQDRASCPTRWLAIPQHYNEYEVQLVANRKLYPWRRILEQVAIAGEIPESFTHGGIIPNCKNREVYRLACLVKYYVSLGGKP